jgi:hypothetical protein
MRIADQEVGEVHQRASVLVDGHDGQRADHRTREGIFGGPALVGVLARRALGKVESLEEVALAHAIDGHELRTAELSAVGAERVGPQARGEARVVDQLKGVPLSGFGAEPGVDTSFGLVLVERQETVHQAELGGKGSDRGKALIACLFAWGHAVTVPWRTGTGGEQGAKTQGEPGSRTGREHAGGYQSAPRLSTVQRGRAASRRVNSGVALGRKRP